MDIESIKAKLRAAEWEPIELATSCSWRRLLRRSGGSFIEPIMQRSDGHPDLSTGRKGWDRETVLGAVVEVWNAAPDLIAEVERLTAERDALKRELDLERCVSRGLRSQVDELSIEVSAALRGMTARISEALHEWGAGYDDGEE